MNDDVLFIYYCINQALASEMVWPNVVGRLILSTLYPHYPGCIEIVDDTL